MRTTFPRLEDRPNRAGAYEIKWAERPEGSKKWITRRYSTRTADRAEARKAFVAFLSAGGPQAAPTGPDFAALVAAYMDDYVRGGGAREATVRLALRFPLQHFGPCAPSQITPAAVDAYRRARKTGALTAGGRHKGVADPTIRRELAQLKAVCSWAAKVGRLPAAEIPLFQMPPAGKPRQGDYAWMDEGQARAWLSDLINWSLGRDAGQRPVAFAVLGLEYGARREAITELDWSRVDFERGTVDFRNPLARASKKRRAVVPMTARVRAALDRIDGPRHGRVVGVEGWRLYYRGFLAACPQWRWVTPHILRHTCATLMLRRGVDLFTVAGVLADDPATVKAVYGHHHPDHLAGAFETTA